MKEYSHVNMAKCSHTVNLKKLITNNMILYLNKKTQ